MNGAQDSKDFDGLYDKELFYVEKRASNIQKVSSDLKESTETSG